MRKLLVLLILLPGCLYKTPDYYLRNTEWRDHPFTVCRVSSMFHYGNGVLIKKTGKTYLVLTASHITPNDDVSVRVISGKNLFRTSYRFEKYSAKVIWRDQKRDLMILRFKSTKNYPIAPRGEPYLDAPLFMFSYEPFKAMVVYKMKYIGQDLMDIHASTDKVIKSGQSGSPMFYANGNLAGILLRGSDFHGDFGMYNDKKIKKNVYPAVRTHYHECEHQNDHGS